MATEQHRILLEEIISEQHRFIKPTGKKITEQHEFKGGDIYRAKFNDICIKTKQWISTARDILATPLR